MTGRGLSLRVELGSKLLSKKKKKSSDEHIARLNFGPGKTSDQTTQPKQGELRDVTHRSATYFRRLSSLLGHQEDIEDSMEEIGKEEGNIIEEEGLNQTQDHAQLEEAQEANTNSVDSVIVEMQKLIGDTGVEIPADTAAPVDPAPIVPIAAEDAEIGTHANANNEPEGGDTGGDKDGIYVYSDVHCKSEVSLKVESDKVVSNVESDVPETVEDAGIGTDANDVLQGDTGGSEVGVYVYSDVHCKSEEALKVESDKVVSNVESDLRGESEVVEKVGGDDVVGNVDSDVQHQSEVCVKDVSVACVENVSEENGEKGKELKDVEVSKAVELNGGAETGDPGGNGDGGSQQTAPMEIEKEDNVGEDGKALKDGVSNKANPSTEVQINAKTDVVVSRVEPEMCPDGEVAKEKQTDGVSSEANPSTEVQINAETDVVSRVDPEMCHDGEVAKEKQTDGVSSKASTEVQINAETDVVVSRLEPEMCHDGEVAKEKQTDGVSSQGNPSTEVQINAETDVVSRVEPEMCNDGEVAKEKQTAGGSSKANPSSEAHMNAQTEFASRVEPYMCIDGEVAKQKLMNGVSSKANETDSVVCKLEHGMPRDSKIAREKLVDAVISKAKRSANEPPSSVKELKAYNVRKVERGMPQDNEVSMETESDSDDDDEKRHALTGGFSSKSKFPLHHDMKDQLSKSKFHVEREVGRKSVDRERTFLLDPGVEGDESGTEEEQVEFMKEVEKVYKENYMEFKPPKFYKEELNLLKLWRAVIKLGGYEKVTSLKLWRQVGESFNPPKTCTTVSWTFRIFYEKALLVFEKHRWHGNEHTLPEPPRVEIRADGQTCGSGRALRDSAARAMQGWHSQRLFGNGEEKPSSTMPKSDKQLKSSGLLKRKKLSPGDSAAQVANMKAARQRLDMTVFDIGPPADWVKINVKRFNDCFEVYALIPGLLREEVHVQSDPVGRLIISGQPMQLDNPWGVAPFKKVVSLPSRIDPHQTSAVVTLNGQLFVRVPFEQSDF